MSSGRWFRRAGGMAALAATLLATPFAGAFTHVVQPGDTLASIAEGYYGRIQFEKYLVAANQLDAKGGSAIVPGTRLEVPALTYHRIVDGDTWETLALAHLGSRERATTLALANDSSPWLKPEVGTQIRIPYNLRIVAGYRTSLPAVAYRYYGDRTRAWVLDKYNNLGGKRPTPGDAILLPLVKLPLTPAGEAAAKAAAQRVRRESQSGGRKRQLQVKRELPALLADVRAGRYVEAVRRGTELLTRGKLPEKMEATIHRQLLEAYVAVGAAGLARGACVAWKKLDPAADLDPTYVSPKILTACSGADQKGAAP